MILLLHVAIALMSVGIASYSYVRPNNANLRVSYSFIGLTLASGFYLVEATPGVMVHACMTGVAYITLVTTVTALTHRKLATARAS